MGNAPAASVSGRLVAGLNYVFTAFYPELVLSIVIEGESNESR